MHPPVLDGQHHRDPFDPIVEGGRYRLSRELSLAIWERVCAAATDRLGRRDTDEAARRFHELAARVAARGGRLHPDVGRVTRVDVEISGMPLGAWSVDELAPRSPGRETLVTAEARSRESWRDVSGASKDADGVASPELPGASEVTRAIAVLQAPRLDQAVPLEPSVGARMSRLFGVDLTNVEVIPESPAVTGSAKAVTKEDAVHFRPGAYQPGTPEGDRLIAHELAHVVQRRGGRSERTGTRRELEREADRAAALAVGGRAAPIQLRADRATAYAFDEGEAHDGALDVNANTHGGDAKADATASAEPADPAGGTARDDHAEKDRAAAVPASHADAPGDHADQDDAAIGDEAAIGAIPAEESPEGPVPGGGAPARPQKEAPSIAAAKPEVGLGQLRGVRPDKLGLLFGQIHTAAGADVAQERANLQANPPKQMSTGAPTADKGAAPRAARAPKPATDPQVDAPKAGHDLPDPPVKAEVPGGEAAKQAQQDQAAEQQKSAPQLVASVARSIASWFSSWFGHGESHDGGPAPKMSEAETRQMSGSIDQLPTSAQGVSTDTGPAPALAMKGEARASADKDRSKLEATTAGLEAQDRADSRAPMGEDHIETTVAPDELTAAPPRGAPAGPALPTVSDAASSEDVGIVAQEQHGAEIDAALDKASGDATAERGKHAQEEQKARTEADAHVRELKTKADADQAAARASAQAEVQQARSQWQAEIDKKGSDARKQADKKVADGMAQAAAEEAKANAEARQHIDEGKRKAEDEKQKGEKEAADAKDKGKQKSSGFFGWVASKAKAAFDGIKKAVSAAIDACRRAVKAVIDAAKKLAMAAINLAREVIVAAIKAVGQALIAISNVLLAAFPALKARFQAAIRKAVDKAVDTVNKLADGIKKAVQKALDLLGAALDKALQLLEKGLDAIIDAANAVVQGAIKAAQAVVDALGTWARLLKDVATGPGAWLRKLGAAVVDGIRNHLWSAFKTTVIDWFKNKVFELLGVGGIILELLLEGGLTREHIIQMALDALMVAIPAALVAILIEKLVSMIIPAAGALMAIIEGLQAAWGTISRIIAAFSAFMAFLLAVKGGTAGALFAAVLASAAVVVLDFVANWLLKKLASAARKVGAKLKGLAEKFKAKRKAKRDAKSAKKHHDEHHGPDGKPKAHHDEHDKKPDKGKEKDKKEDTPAQKQARLDAAIAEVKGLMSKRQRLSLLLRARLLLIRRKFKLDKLEAKKKGAANAWDIFAKINPEARFDLFSIEDDAADLRKAVGTRLASLPASATIADVKALCSQAAASHLAPGYTLDWQYLRDSWVLFLNRPKHDIPRTAVGEFRKTNHYREIEKHENQTLFRDDDGKEYVHDSADQYVPRILTRNISEQDRKALRKKRDLAPTGPRSRTEIWQHVTGTKPSPYISATKIDDGDITNPQGDALGGEHGRVRIDLLKISPKRIHDLTTKKGQDRWGLSHPKTDIKRQALEDVIRTQEVLIKGEIPFEAIEQI
ncbi:MAG TPA: DUF4157 domain-containing protein [Kofleriaceae bacterium]